MASGSRHGLMTKFGTDALGAIRVLNAGTGGLSRWRASTFSGAPAPGSSSGPSAPTRRAPTSASAPYTLKSISAVVLGGASIFGGRGSFIGAFFGAVLIQEIITASGFLQQTTHPFSDIPSVLPRSLSFRNELIVTGELMLLALVLYQGGELWVRARAAWQDLCLRIQSRENVGTS